MPRPREGLRYDGNQSGAFPSADDLSEIIRTCLGHYWFLDGRPNFGDEHAAAGQTLRSPNGSFEIRVLADADIDPFARLRGCGIYCQRQLSRPLLIPVSSFCEWPAKGIVPTSVGFVLRSGSAAGYRSSGALGDFPALPSHARRRWQDASAWSRDQRDTLTNPRCRTTFCTSLPQHMHARRARSIRL